MLLAVLLAGGSSRAMLASTRSLVNVPVEHVTTLVSSGTAAADESTAGGTESTWHTVQRTDGARQPAMRSWFIDDVDNGTCQLGRRVGPATSLLQHPEAITHGRLTYVAPRDVKPYLSAQYSLLVLCHQQGRF